jgi:hypothetical protein
MTMRVKSFRQEAKDFYWPRGGWAGWVRFFNPSVSGRVSQPCHKDLYSGLFGQHSGNLQRIGPAERIECLERVIETLETPHWKDVYAKYVHGPIGEVECFPTNDALEGAELLRQCLCEFELGL